MAGRVSPLVRAGCFALLSLLGCRGTEHTLFTEITPTVVDRSPQSLRDASVPDSAAAGGAGEGGSAAPTLDAGSPPPFPDAGPLPPDPDLDPNVSFPWTETLPGKGTCRKGLYIGSFSCTQAGASGLDALVVWTGRVVITLEGSEEEQVLRIKKGEFTDDGFPVFLNKATLDGSLDCLKNQSLVARATGSSLTFNDYETMVVGWLDSNTLVITGGFQVTTDANTRWICNFEANAAP